MQLGELVDQLIAYWRDLMVVNCAGERGPRPERAVAPSRDADAAGARRCSLDTILAGLDVLSTTKARLRGSNHGRTLVEMALVRLGRLDDLVSLAQLAQWLGQAGATGAREPTRARGGSRAALPGGGKKKAPEPRR